MQRKCSRSSVHINSWPCGYVPNYLLHISLILTHATLASLENGDFKKKKKNNWRIVYSALANVLHSSILSPVWKPRAGVQFVVVFSPPLPHFALVTRSVFVCFRIWICGCVHRKASCRLPFVISRFLTPCHLRSGSAHGAVLTCPQAGATHTTVCTYAGKKKIQTQGVWRCWKCKIKANQHGREETEEMLQTSWLPQCVVHDNQGI